MLGFAMDCFLAGLAMCLMIDATQSLWFAQERDHKTFLWVASSFGLAIFMLSRFLMSFWIMWNSWE